MIRIKKSILPPKEEYFHNLNENMTVYQSYRSFKDSWIPSIVNGIRTRTIPMFLYLSENEKCQMILPIMYSKKRSFFYGNSSACGMARLSPVIYCDINEEKQKYYLKKLLEFIGSETYSFSRMTNSIANILFDAVGNDYSVVKSFDECVSIDYSQHANYDDYFCSLSKSVRQNIRTAYNRLNKDEHSYEFKLFKGKEVDDSLRKELIGLFLDRHEERYGTKHTKYLSLYYNHFDFVDRSVRHNENTCTAVFFIDNEPAAFFTGFHDRNTKTMYVPRLAINGKFGTYSPGMLLVSEAIKESFNGRELRVMDLLIGEEKYKYSLGGESIGAIL